MDESGPWNDYAPSQPSEKEETGPWTDYASPPAQETAPTSIPADIGKSFVAGVGRGAVGLAGMPGDLGSIAANARSLADRAGISPEVTNAVINSIPAPLRFVGQAMQHMPTSGQIQQKVEGVTGPFHQPQTMAGRFAEFGGELLPGMAGGPETLASRAISRVAVPAIAGQGAQELTRGTPLEPYAKPAAAFAAGIGATRALAPRAAALAAPELPTAEAYKEAVDNGFNNLRGYGVELKRPSVSKMVDDTIQELESRGRTEANSEKTLAALNRLKNPKGEHVTFNDIESVRQELGQVPFDERMPAAVAKKNLMDYLGDIAPEDAAVNGHFVPRLRPELKEAVANSAVQHQLEKFQEIREFAENSTRDTNDAILAKWRTILANKNQRRQFPDDIRQAMTQAVRENKVDKVLGVLSKMAPDRFAGWFPAVVGTLAGRAEMLGIPAVGTVAKTIKNIGTGRSISAIEKMAAQRGPLYQKARAAYEDQLARQVRPKIGRQPGDFYMPPGGVRGLLTDQSDMKSQP